MAKFKIPQVVTYPTRTDKKYYFDNNLVEDNLVPYLIGGCVDVAMRDKIMKHAEELIRQIILAHNLHRIYPGQDESTCGDLFQTAWCVHPDTIVMTSNGMEKIGNIVPVDGSGDCDIDVFGVDGLQKANKFINIPPSPTRIITTKYGYSIECSMDHPLLVSEGGQVWKATRDIKIGDKLAVQIAQNQFGNRDEVDVKIPENPWMSWKIPQKFTKELANIIGLVISKGTMSNWIIEFNGLSARAANELTFNNLGLATGSQGAPLISSSAFHEFINKLYIGSSIYNRQIPPGMMKCSKDILVALIRGILDRDDNSQAIGFESPSKILVTQLQIILANIGILSEISIKPRGKYDEPYEVYRLRSVSEITDKIDSGPNANIVWLPVQNITSSNSRTVDIQVPTSQTFTTNCIISHNCQIERTLYKYKARPHCAACYSPLKPQDSVLYEPASTEYGIITPEEVARKRLRCPACKRIPPKIIYRGTSKIFNLWCVKPDTMVFTTDGINTIEKVVAREGYDDRQEIWTLGINGPRKIIAAVRKPVRPVRTIKTQCGYEVSCTDEHGLMILGDNGPEWRKASELKRGDLLGIQYNQRFFVGNDDISDIKLTEKGEWQPPQKITEELAYIIGLYIAKGHIAGKRLNIAVNRKLAEAVNIVGEYNNGVIIRDGRFIEFVTRLGLDKREFKTIPARLLKISEANMDAMLRGIYDAGYYTSSNEQLIAQLRMLLLNNGSMTRTIRRRGKYQLRIAHIRTNRTVSTEWLPITKITNSESEVCEISVDSDDHSYIANGIISHNSQVSRTVILAYIKKESRDHKNADSYKLYLDRKINPENGIIGRFMDEAEQLCQHNKNHLTILKALKYIMETDDRPSEGIIGKLVRYSNQSRAQVSNFLKMIRLRSDEFTDAPINERPKNHLSGWDSGADDDAEE